MPHAPLRIAAGLAALVLLLGCAAAGKPKAGATNPPDVAGAPPPLPEPFRPRPGVEAAEVAGTDVLHRQHVALSQLKGQVVFLNFWATWCQPCRDEMPAMQQLQAQLGDKVRFVAFDQDAREEPETLLAFAKEVKVDLPLIWDEGKAGRVYRIVGLPTSYVIDKDGKITATQFGQADRQKMIDKLATAGIHVGS